MIHGMTMMTKREQVINDMCYTVRHDYGLDKDPNDNRLLTAGMTESEREALRRHMAQIFDNSIWPHMVFRDD